MDQEDNKVSEMSDEFKDIEKKSKYKDYIIIILLYIVVIILTIFLVLGLKNKKNLTIENNKNKASNNAMVESFN